VKRLVSSCGKREEKAVKRKNETTPKHAGASIEKGGGWVDKRLVLENRKVRA
jgi:hypothetical protein